MSNTIIRRDFLTAAAGAMLSIGIYTYAIAAEPNGGFDFLVLGDIHHDQLEHHDFEQLERDNPKIIPQIQYYCHFTRENTPKLYDKLRSQVQSNDRIKFVAQLGDFVQGHAGDLQRARKHLSDALALVEHHAIGVPFFIIKGNHDVTGEGSVQAYNDVIVPHIADELKRLPESAVVVSEPSQNNTSYAYSFGDVLFAYLDTFSDGALDWLEATLAKRTQKHVFVSFHRNAVPNGCRHSWNAYMDNKEQRTRLYNLLGDNQAVVLTAHVHKHVVLVRRTQRGAFVNVSVCSVLTRLPQRRGKIIKGKDKYVPDLVLLDKKKYTPKLEALRRSQIAQEQPHVTYFEYGDVHGYAHIAICEDGILANFYTGLEPEPWNTVNLSELLDGALALD